MKFVDLHVNYKELMLLIRQIPEQWWKAPHGEIQALMSSLRTSPHEVTSRHATSISTTIGQIWIREQMDKAGRAKKSFKPLYVNCMVSEERLVTFYIPMTFAEEGEENNFYQVRVEPSKAGEFSLRFFHPDGVQWFARLAAFMTYVMEIGTRQVSVDGDWISIKAWNAVCALGVAQGVDGTAGILMDMARDGEI